MIPQSQPTRNVIFLLFDDGIGGMRARACVCVFFVMNTILTNYHLTVLLLFDGWTTARRVNVTSLKRAVVCCKCNVYGVFILSFSIFNSSIRYYYYIRVYLWWRVSNALFFIFQSHIHTYFLVLFYFFVLILICHLITSQ